ncbi:MAG TPA: hypothetical protein VF092_25220 [Longimicrobium sp.]
MPTEPVAGDRIPPPEPLAGDPATPNQLVARDPWAPPAPVPTDDELARINAEYLRRKRRLNLAGLAWLLYGALILFTLRPGEVSTMVAMFAGVPFIYAAILYIWRCPKCNGYLGPKWAVHRCPSCDVVLDPRG